MAMTLPGAAENEPFSTKARGGVRWRMALTVVRSTDGPFAGATRADSVAMRFATTVGCGETRS